MESMEDPEALPVEVWHRIMRFLAPDDFYALKCVCSSWAHYAKSDGPWIAYMHQFFGTRYEKVKFVADPTLSWMDKFWRTTRLHQNWKKGTCSTSFLGGTLGVVRQIRMNGDTLAINTGQQLKVFDLNKNKSIWHLNDEIPLGYPIPTFDLWGNLLLMPGSSDHSSLTMMDITTGKRAMSIATNQSIAVVRHCPVGNWFASGGRKIQVWDPNHTSTPQLTLQEQHRGVVNCLEIDQNTITACHKGKKIRMWDIRSGERILTLSGHNHLIHCIALNSHHIASGSKDATIRLWDRRKTESSTVLTGHTRPVRALVMDDWKIVSGGREHTIMVWDVAQQKRMFKLTELEGTHALALNETHLYVGSSSLVRHDFTPKIRGKIESTFDCALS